MYETKQILARMFVGCLRVSATSTSPSNYKQSSGAMIAPPYEYEYEFVM